MIAAIQDSLVSMVLAGIVLLTAMFVKRVVVHTRLHHPRANRRFKLRYRVAHSLSTRTTVEGHLPPAALPVVRSRTPADAGGCPTTASAGSIQERRVA